MVPAGDKGNSDRLGWILLVAGLGLYVLLRLPFVGHLLIWDEAMNLCTVRALASAGQDYYSGWFWRHPPALGISFLLARPLEPGFAERAELLVILVGAVSAFVLFLLAKTTWGRGPAIWAVFFYAVIPGAVFHDVWLKQDVFATLFGLLALLAFVRKRMPVAGVLLGLAFLGKETALFYAMAIGVMWLAGAHGRRWRDILLVAFLAALASGWWYLGFTTAMRYFLAFVTGLPLAKTDIDVWVRPWHYYLGLLPLDLGWGGVALCLLGLLALFGLGRQPSCSVLRSSLARRSVFAKAAVASVGPCWPLAVLLPAYVLLSAMTGKAPWFVATLYPAFAGLLGVGADGVVRALRRTFQRVPALGARGPVLLAGALAALLAWGFVWNAWGRDYDTELRKREEPLWWGASASREAALTLNRLVQDGQKVLITPMHYWLGEKPIPCAIFTCYLKDMPVAVRPYDLTADDFVAAVKEYGLDWAMVSPDPAVAEEQLFEPLRKRYRLEPLRLQGTCVYRTERIHRAR